ncbi:hypothetical protein SAMN04488034_103327 [Salinimicrobium catena]|uniref:Uncharacterized protein n=1 Tax=Salinimicrobium catena TaxID=390640 RepID=A0A1H5N4B8_9FLAO|nr:hypothetical protein SAMN04488140_103327 [Salinimicrobium catena]SEE96432.1 hypothetical protein SAMN04488034_103327 [Salinimicrobium catena]
MSLGELNRNLKKNEDCRGIKLIKCLNLEFYKSSSKIDWYCLNKARN